ncbi:MAG TPA: tetratricopeptide repeat protein, partial [Candidatus Cloacimonadota bacterium]|nr:tetratricopeptide repeat protein [Candidatus Cloacimonadota bacterium]
MRKTFLIIFLLVLIVGLYAQYDEKAILLKQAQDMMQSRRFKQAEAIYTDLMSKYPSDYVVVLNLINLYIQTSNADKAYDLLNAKKDIFPSNVFSEQKISLLLQKNQVDEAFRLATDYLEQNRNQITLYRNIAALFEIRFQY